MLLPGDRNNRRLGAVDAVLLPLLLALVFYAYWRVRTGLRYNWDWSFLPQFFFRRDVDTGRIEAGSLTLGLLTTIRLSIWSSILALIMGTVAGIARSGQNRVAKLFGRIYVEVIRNIPPLVIVFIFYFFFGNQIIKWIGIEAAVARAGPGTRRLLAIFFSEPKRIPEFFSAVITLGIYEGAYITEIVRAGIESVPRGQWEAGHAIGLSKIQQYRFIVLPLALRSILPSLAGQFISAIKDSAIVSVISIQEITFQGLELMASTYRTFEVWITITILYLMLTATCSAGARRIESITRRVTR